MVAFHRPKIARTLEGGSSQAYLRLLGEGYLSVRGFLHPLRVVELIDATNERYPKRGVQPGRELWRDVIEALDRSGYVSTWGRVRLRGYGLSLGETNKVEVVVEISDQDGQRSPLARHFRGWLELMKAGDFVAFLHRDGGQLFVQGPATGPFLIRCSDAAGRVLAEAREVPYSSTCKIIESYIAGQSNEVLRSLS